ncbi:hypothetical protein [Pseudomonas phoenicis]|uniref:hypothetical protein n=1 Tax=unclassified Pseudomonas TaxID=196821 RepID=UPI0039A385F9
MSVFTVYFCGTGSQSFDAHNVSYWNGELVSTLASHDQGREFADWIVMDGPGSGNLQDDQLFVEPGRYFNWTGQLFGKGWEENVQHALQVIKGKADWQRQYLSEEEYQKLQSAGVEIPPPSETGSWFWRTYDYGERKTTPQQLQEQIIHQFRKPVIPEQVNLVGWSRGGISCHMLANAMAADPELSTVAVNIFAIDPVPGVGNISTERVELADNVKEYVGFYSRDERSKGFACVIPKTRPTTHVHVYPMPGRHATLVGNASIHGDAGGDALKAPGLVVRHFAEVCLARWGVKLDKTLGLDDRQLMGYHQQMAQDDEQYVAMRSVSYTMLTEGKVDDRRVHLGSDDTAFSKITGDSLEPCEGLHATQTSVDSYRHLR